MSSTHKNNVRFGAIELPLILFILVIFSLAGWYFLRVRTQANHALHPYTSTNQQKQSDTAPSPIVAQSQSVAASGIKGEVMRGAGTGCFSQDPNSSCGKPPQVQATIDIQAVSSTPHAGADSVTRVTSDANGTFSINLTPGDYILVPQPLSNGETSGPQRITVVSGQYASVTFVYN